MKLFNSHRITQRQDAQKILQKLNNVNGKVLVIHYSCQSFYEESGKAPRVTSIAVLNKENNESTIFSLYLSAQLTKKDISNLSEPDLDEVEKHMLDEFSKYVQNHMSYIWLHWNMRSANFGFQAISNRYKILGGTEISIPDTNKIDLSEVFGQLFTYNFETDKPDGKLLNLAERNRISRRDALVGADEPAAFIKKEYLSLHMSTSRKVEIIDRLLTGYKSGELKHNARTKDVYGLSILGIISLVRESPPLWIFWSILIFITGVIADSAIQKAIGLCK